MIKGNENAPDLSCLHNDLLECLLTFDDLCKTFKLNYSLHGGTLLGAVRSHSFIPWDDDIDVSMKREDYETLKSLVSSSYNSNYYIDDSASWVPKFVLDSKKVYLDIFIWDYISNNKLSQLFKVTLIRAFQGMLKTQVDYSKYSLSEKLLVFTTQSFGKLFPKNTLMYLFDRIQKKAFVGDKTMIHRSNDSFSGCSYIYDKDFFDNFTEIEFENHSFPVNSRFEEFLIDAYGSNYMDLPPKEMRFPSHQNIYNEVINQDLNTK